MTLIRALIRRLDALQRLRWARIVMSVMVVGGAAGFFGTIISSRMSYDSHKESIVSALTGDEGTTYGLILRENGVFVLDGTEYSAPLEACEVLIEDSGQVQNLQWIVYLLLRDYLPTWVPQWLLLEPELAVVMLIASIAIGLAVVWSGLLLPVLSLLLGGFMAAFLFWVFGADSVAAVPIAIAILLSVYLVLIRCAQLLLVGRSGWAAVAHTLLCEVTRTRLSLTFVSVLLIAMPLLPLTLNYEAPIDQVVQAYLDRSLGLAFAVVALLVLLIGCSSISFDVRDRHIWHLVTKPLGRAQYLFGKWIGIVIFGGIMMMIAGAWSYGYLRYIDSTTSAPRNEAEFVAREALETEVLVAYTSRRPVYEELDDAAVRARIDQIILEDPAYRDHVDGEVPLMIRRTIQKRVHDEFDQNRRRVVTQRSRSAPPWRLMHFEGLGEAKKLGLPLRLEFRLLGGGSDEHDRRMVGIAIGEDRTQGAVGGFIPTVPQHIDIPASSIADDGTLDVTICNLTHLEPPSGNDWFFPANLEMLAATQGNLEPFEVFWLPDQFEIAYSNGTFESNFFRGLLVLMIKLAILAALSCGAATILSFPVAMLFVFTIYAAASLAPWLSTALPSYGTAVNDESSVGLIIQSILQFLVRTVAQGIVYLLYSFGELSPISSVVEGRLISLERIGRAAFMLVVWGGGALVIGWLVLSRRQLAIYSGEQ